MAAAAGSQSPTATTAAGRRSCASRTAAATAHVPNSSAAGIDSVGSVSTPRCCLSRSRSSAVAAPRCNAACTAAGHVTVTSHTTPWWPSPRSSKA
eukprot:1937958-Pleurochrysis_carterae.AAC.1